MKDYFIFLVIFPLALVGFMVIFRPVFQWIGEEFPRVNWGGVLGLFIIVGYTALAILGLWQLYSWWV